MKRNSRDCIGEVLACMCVRSRTQISIFKGHSDCGVIGLVGGRDQKQEKL
jgi:hypothetical protein